jgi:hypothetical protein
MQGCEVSAKARVGLTCWRFLAAPAVCCRHWTHPDSWEAHPTRAFRRRLRMGLRGEQRCSIQQQLPAPTCSLAYAAIGGGIPQAAAAAAVRLMLTSMHMPSCIPLQSTCMSAD